MTENKQNDDNQDNQAQNVVYVKKRSVYAPFLLVMLILSSIYTVFSTFNGLGLIAGLATGDLSYDGIVRIFVNGVSLLIFLGSIAALALLWLRRKEGIILKFVLLALTVAISVFSTGIFRNDLLKSSQECRAGAIGGENLDVNIDLDYECEDIRIVYNIFDELGGGLVIFGIILSVFWNGGIATLWYFAWRAQEKHDGIEKFLGKKASK